MRTLPEQQVNSAGWAQNRKVRSSVTALLAAATGIFAGLYPALAETSDLSLELNRTASTERGCTLTFVAGNRTGTALNGVAYEFVLFNKDGLVEKMTAFDFGAIPDRKTVVRQFELAGTQCGSIGQILVNGAARCEAATSDSAAEETCISSLATASRTDIAFIK